MSTQKIRLILTVLLLFGCNSSIVDDPSILISFFVPEDSHVRLIVENSYDTLIATLVDEERPAGYYKVSFDASNLAEGIYFYTVELKGVSGSYTQSTRNMLLIK